MPRPCATDHSVGVRMSVDGGRPRLLLDTAGMLSERVRNYPTPTTVEYPLNEPCHGALA